MFSTSSSSSFIPSSSSEELLVPVEGGDSILYPAGSYLKCVSRDDDYCYVLKSSSEGMKIVWASTGDRELFKGAEISDFTSTTPPPREKELCSQCKISVIRMRSKVENEFLATKARLFRHHCRRRKNKP